MSCHKTLATLQASIASIVFLFVGIILLIVSEWPCLVNMPWLKAILANFGGLLFASMALSIIWELFAKRAFFNEILSKTNLVDDIRKSGISGISVESWQEFDYGKHIRKTKSLDIYICYANTWRNTYEADLKALASQDDVCIRLIVPDTTDDQLMEFVGKRFSMAGHDLKNKIDESVKELSEIFDVSHHKKLRFEIWIHKEVPTMAFYKFDDFAVMTLHKIAAGRGNVPTIVAEKPGDLFVFVENEVKALVDGLNKKPPLASLMGRDATCADDDV